MLYKPYKYLDDNKLTQTKISPERGQLLITIANSKLDTNTILKIFEASNFDHSDLNGAKFNNVYLKNLRMNDASMINCSFGNSNLQNISFYNCNLSNSSFYKSNLKLAFMTICDLSNASFWELNSIHNAAFPGSILDSTTFRFVNFNGVQINDDDFSSSKFYKCEVTKEWIDKNKNKDAFRKILKSNYISEIPSRNSEGMLYYIQNNSSKEKK